MTLDEFIEYFKNISVDDVEAIGFTFTEMQQVADYLEELKDLREKYKNVSEAFMKCNLELFGLMKERNEQ